jgi:hypothetical protein
MQDDEDPEDPTREQDGEVTVEPPPSPPDEVELARWWHQYCNMAPPRPWTKLAEIVHAQKRRVRKAIYEGWPEHGIPAFRDRERAPEPMVAEVVGRAQAQAIERVATVVANSWASDAERHLRGLPKIGQAIDRLCEVLIEQAEQASLVKYRAVPDLDEKGEQRRDPTTGAALTIMKPYVSASDAALAAQRLMAARKDHAVLNKALLDSLAPFRSSEIDFSDAPPEVMEYLKKKFVGRAA